MIEPTPMSPVSAITLIFAASIQKFYSQCNVSKIIHFVLLKNPYIYAKFFNNTLFSQTELFN
ncbi:MAG: hypothetical protein OHK0036_10710 [Bacteroidia bacterium]